MFFGTRTLVFSKMLFWRIKSDRGLLWFPKLNWRSIKCKRRRRNETPEQKAEYSAKMSKIMSPIMKKIMPKIRKKYMKTITPEQKAAFAKRMSDGQTRYWKNISKEKKAQHMKKMHDGNRIEANPTRYIERSKKFYKIDGVEHKERINTYSGVISLKELEAL